MILEVMSDDEWSEGIDAEGEMRLIKILLDKKSCVIALRLSHTVILESLKFIRPGRERRLENEIL